MEISIKYEEIEKTELNNLIGGFSISLSADSNNNQDLESANNCLGGNCTQGCDYYQNIACNGYVGCSKQK